MVGTLARAFVRGLRAGGMLATLKHFPGHGDTDVDSHLGLPIIKQPRERLDAMELRAVRAGHRRRRRRGDDRAHRDCRRSIQRRVRPATLSRPIVTGLLRGEMKFNGLIYTDSMGMDAVSKRLSPGEAAVARDQGRQRHRAALAGRCGGGRGDQGGGREGRDRDRADRRVGPAHAAREGAARAAQARTVSLDDVRDEGRRRAKHAAVAQAVSQQSITLVKDDRNQVPLRVPRESAVLYLSVLDYPRGLAHRGAQPHVHPGAAEALAERDGDRAVGSDDDRGDRARARDGAALRRHRRRPSSCAPRRPAAGWIWRRRS